MKRIAFILCLLLAVSVVVSCGNKTVEIRSDNNKDTEISEEVEEEREPRELQEADQQPPLWVAYQEFLEIQSDLPASQSLKDNSQVQQVWSKIEQERASWAENPYPRLTNASIDDIYKNYIDVEPLYTQFAINSLLYNGASFDVINQLHQLKNDNQAFVDKFNEMLR